MDGAIVGKDASPIGLERDGHILSLRDEIVDVVRGIHGEGVGLRLVLYVDVVDYYRIAFVHCNPVGREDIMRDSAEVCRVKRQGVVEQIEYSGRRCCVVNSIAYTNSDDSA